MDTKTGDVSPLKADADLLDSVRKALPILADLSRSDLLLYVPTGPDQALISDQARPHSIFPIYEENLVGKRVLEHEAPWVFRALSNTLLSRGVQHGAVRGAPIVREVLPVLGNQRQPLAALSIETNLLAYERHRRRNVVFRRALQQLQEMVLRGELQDAEHLSPFGEHDGVVVMDLQRRIRYVSGIAANLYRRIGYMGSLLHRTVYHLETTDAELADEALNLGKCVEREGEEHGRFWVRKAIPLYVPRKGLLRLQRRAAESVAPPGSVPAGVIWTVHDATEARDKERELRAKLAMIQEIHHRVKNNLQAIASLLRLQARRADSPELQQALTDTVNRILSVAVVHEFLSYDSTTVINVRDVAQRIVDQMSQSVMDPNKGIRFELNGPSIYLSSQQATTCALVINELLLNAVQHGYKHRDVGLVTVDLTDDGEWIGIHVGDDGTGLPSDFDLEQDGGLGLQIVRRLVQGDLKGKFELHGDQGVKAIVAFPKIPLGGAKS